MADPFLGMFEAGSGNVDEMNNLQNPQFPYGNQNSQPSDRLQHPGSFPGFSSPNQGQPEFGQSQTSPYFDRSSMSQAQGFAANSQKLQHFDDPMLSSSPSQGFQSMQGESQQQFAQLTSRSNAQFVARPPQMNWRGPQQPPTSGFPFIDQSAPNSALQQQQFRGMFEYGFPRSNSPRLQHFADQGGINSPNMAAAQSQASRLGQQVSSPVNSNLRFSTPSPETSAKQDASQLRHYPNMMDLNQQQDLGGQNSVMQRGVVPTSGADAQGKPPFPAASNERPNFPQYYDMNRENMAMQKGSPGKNPMEQMYNSYGNPAMGGYMGGEVPDGMTSNPMGGPQGGYPPYQGYGMPNQQDVAHLKTSSVLLQMQKVQQQIQQLREMPQQAQNQVQPQIQQLQHQFQQLCHVYMMQQQRMQQGYPMQAQQDQMQFIQQQKHQDKANRIAVEAMAKAAFQNEGSSMMQRFQQMQQQHAQAIGGKPMQGNDRSSVMMKSEPLPLGQSIVNKPTASRTARPPATILSKPIPARNRREDSDGEPSPPSSPVSNEEDQGSSITRRSLREKRKKIYKDDFDYNLSDEEGERHRHAQTLVPPAHDTGGEMAPLPPEEYEEVMIVEKILSSRLRDVEAEDGTITKVEEFHVKFKNYSYLHAEWATAEKLAKGDKRVQMKIKRYKAKQLNTAAFFSEMEEDSFNPDYVEVDRVLDMSTGMDHNTGEPITHFLVKWRSLPYEESTWEVKADVEESKIQQFYKLREPPPLPQRQFRPRPYPHEWHKLETSPVYKDENTLREYQLEGVNWLMFCWCNRQNSILADEMGLGKTIQSIAFLFEMQRYGIRGPNLVIAPLSTISNWQREFESWNDINAVVYHGSASSRHLIQEYEFYYRDEHGQPIPNIFKFQVLITTYEIIIADNMQLSTVPWRAVIIDEAHRLKNRNCKLLEGLNNLQMEHRILLTGTPLQNNVEELFSLLNFLEPSQFPSQGAFLMEFGDLKTESQVDKLKQLLKPMMLRRLKEDVEKNIAPKEETIIEVELTTVQKKFYRAILERNFAFLAKGTSSTANVPNLMNTMMELRKCCNHPFLITGAEEKILQEYGREHVDRHTHAMIEASGKLVLIHKLLPKLKLGGHKVLVFSQMVRCLDILEDYLVHMKYPYERIDGRVRGNLRQAAIDRFSKPDSDRFVFLLCTRAGGLGINLTAADTVIIFDSDWNPQNDLQAQARCHRIGQSRSVKVYRLITRNSYEREMFDRASMKLGLDKAVLQSMNTKENAGNNGQMSKREIEDLLKRGAYGAIMEEDNDDASKFCEEDIDQILERRTQVIQVESEGKGSTFAKASFVSAKGDDDIDVDDPDFWEKWAKKADLDVDYLNNKDERILDAPRQRKQTRRYGNEDGDFELSDIEMDEEDVKVPHRSSWTRVECFRVEKNLLIYGWGRFKEILTHGRFKTKIGERDVESISRTILVYCLSHYHGDDKVKSFIRDIIKASVLRDRISHDDRDSTYSPIPTPTKGRGRGKRGKGAPKKSNKSAVALLEVGQDWKTIDPESIVLDNGYKKHLQHHCNKILLRVRLLYYLKTEVIGNLALQIREGKCRASDLDIAIYSPEGDPPCDWWDVDADKSLLVGVFKHGYERYNLIRADPTLCFLSRVGLANRNAADAADNSVNDGDDRDDDDNDADPDYHQPNPKDEDDLDDEEDKDTVSAISSPGTPRKLDKGSDGGDNSSSGLRWPGASDLNTRLRRLINGYQRVYKKQELKKAAQEKERERKERFEEAIRQKEQKKLEMAQKWSKREEVDFYRTVSTFGVEFDEKEGRYDWSRFRRQARLDKKNDERLEQYLHDFMAMCRRVCGRPRDDEGDRGLNVEPISEERANRCLYRIQLLNKIREEVLQHKDLDERLKLCQPSSDFPDWWICGVHDKDLLRGVSKHGLVRTDYHVLNDPELCFAEILTKLAASQPPKPPTESPQVYDEDGNPSTAVKSEPNPSLDEFPAPKSAEKAPSDTDCQAKPSILSNILASNDTTSGNGLGYPQPKSSENGNHNESSNPPEPRSEPKPEVDADRYSQESGSISMGMIEEDSQMSGTLEGQGSTYGEPTLISVKWPKDRIVMQRLDAVCHCVLKKEWPASSKIEAVLPNMSALSPSAGYSNLDLDMNILNPGVGMDDPDDPSKPFKVQRLDGLKISLKKKRRKKKESLLGDQDSLEDCDSPPVPRKPRKPKDVTGHWPPHGLDMDLPITDQIPANFDPTLSEKPPKKRRRRKEDKGEKGEKPEKPPTGKKRGRKPKTAKLGSAGQPGDSGGTPHGESMGYDWTGQPLPPRIRGNGEAVVPGLPPPLTSPVRDERGLMSQPLPHNKMSSDKLIAVIDRETGRKLSGNGAPTLKSLAEWLERNRAYDVAEESAKLVLEEGNLPSNLLTRVPKSPRPKQTTPSSANPSSAHHFFSYVKTNNTGPSFKPAPSDEDSDSSSQSTPSPPPPPPSWKGGYPYDSRHMGAGYPHASMPYGAYGGMPYVNPYMPNNGQASKSPGVTNPQGMSPFMFGNAFASMFGTQGGSPGAYPGYPYMGMNNGGTGYGKDTEEGGHSPSVSPEAPSKVKKPVDDANSGSKSPKSIPT
ncbi:chromodomain-helicase-DNA-binding protein 8 isoform X2 [Nematostella vectensis]|uniref:chromodomain-helicase-DNA-binding protein 8 isoform X2 n=1 Tax=Nematostella vectensis TaxID=45351 RepID=UPI00138FF549|nr:chromodomain-helicase-DNA-binding protein 8 isoform X2 [Nematostella vectensis]